MCRVAGESRGVRTVGIHHVDLEVAVPSPSERRSCLTKAALEAVVAAGLVGGGSAPPPVGPSPQPTSTELASRSRPRSQSRCENRPLGKGPQAGGLGAQPCLDTEVPHKRRSRVRVVIYHRIRQQAASTVRRRMVLGRRTGWLYQDESRNVEGAQERPRRNRPCGWNGQA